jgi:two-component system response regulator NreC
MRILLADDRAVLRADLRALLDAETDMTVVGEGGTGDEAIVQVRALSPDVVVMDLSMPGMGGLEATRRVTALGLGTRVLALTFDAGQEYLLPVLSSPRDAITG